MIRKSAIKRIVEKSKEDASILHPEL